MSHSTFGPLNRATTTFRGLNKATTTFGVTHVGDADNTGVIAQTLPAFTQAASAGIRYQASIAQTLPSFTQSAEGGEAAEELLLDTYTGAAAAYSLRKLRADYAGSAIRVRRSSDDTEQDIGFDGNDLDESALTTFVGAADGFVVTWYDQSGNARDSSNSTAAEQPQVVASGAVFSENSKPAIDFLGSGYLQASYSPSIRPHTLFWVVKEDADNVNRGHFAFAPLTGSDWERADALSIGAGNTDYGLTVAASNLQLNYPHVGAIPQTLFTHTIRGENDAELYADGISEATDTSYSVNSTASGNLIIGARFLSGAVNTGFALDGRMQEVIYFDTDKSENRTGIETDINTYYSIF